MLTISKTNLLSVLNKKNFSEIYPRVTKKVFLPSTTRKKPQKDPLAFTTNITPHFELKKGPRMNHMGVQMLSTPIYDQIFKNLPNDNLSSQTVESCRLQLKKFGIKDEGGLLEDVNFVIPPLEGKNLEEHFWKISNDQAQPYKKVIDDLLLKIPDKPNDWLMQEGWTRYTKDKVEKVEAPLEECLVFDVEVCMLAGKTPTLATAVSSKAWYGWVSPSLLEGSSKPITNHFYLDNSLIPLGKIPKIIVGHNVSFDRSKIKEQYQIENTSTRFLDTMSLHICVSGITSYQRAVLKSKSNEHEESWQDRSSLNSLSDVHKLYCGKPIEKEARNVFFNGTLSEIKADFYNLMDYCANDVIATFNVLKELYPLFLDRFPHPATLAGMLELSTAFLPVNSNWERYIEESDQTYQDLEIESRLLLAKRADLACQLLHGAKYKEDIWLWDLDWDVKNIKLKKAVKTTKKAQNYSLNQNEDEPEFIFSNLTSNLISVDKLNKKFSYLEETKSFLPAVKTLLPGYPNWYRKLCTKFSEENWIPGPHLITTSMQVTPKLLNLTWEGYPLHYIREQGWGLLVPFNNDTETERKLPLKNLLIKCPILTQKSNEANTSEINIGKDVETNLSRKEYYSKLKKDHSNGLYKGTGIWCNTIIEDCCFFFKLPHKDGASFHVGNPLAKDFLTKFSENVLAGDTESAEKVLSIARQMSYWRNNRDRITNQMVVWTNLKEKLGAIIPQVVVSGTLTRRAVEATWMTASNAHPERVGSELRAMVQAPPGYCIIGADVDSQELWIASVIGDATYKMHAATPLGWMTLSGDKASGTDMHSVTAKAVGISRDHAKVINYARIYGAGQNFAERLIKQFNPSMSESEARSKANKMFTLTKGKLTYHLKSDYIHDFSDVPYTKWQAHQLSKLHGKKIDDMFLKSKWVGGTESAMFNRLEEIAGTPSPVTPFLTSRLSRALEPSSMETDRFLPTRINWVVQSGAVDFLHLMLVCMRWIMGDKARFCLSFHDEIRYLVPEKYKYQAALAMHVTNLLTRSFCSLKLGLYDLPQSVAFFSSVEIDEVLRKDSKQDCKTPSNPHGLEKGYGIRNGESLNIYEAIKKANGTTNFWYK
nr:DNA polymerase subunit gamma-1, mitochondrial [Onthophagus taurus]